MARCRRCGHALQGSDPQPLRHRKALEKGDQRWGETPFRIGLWVGRRTTPNKSDAAEAIKQLRGHHSGAGGAGIGSPSFSPDHLTRRLGHRLAGPATRRGPHSPAATPLSS